MRTKNKRRNVLMEIFERPEGQNRDDLFAELAAEENAPPTEADLRKRIVKLQRILDQLTTGKAYQPRRRMTFQTKQLGVSLKPCAWELVKKQKPHKTVLGIKVRGE